MSQKFMTFLEVSIPSWPARSGSGDPVVRKPTTGDLPAWFCAILFVNDSNFMAVYAHLF